MPEVLKERGTYVDCTPQAFADAIADAMAKPNLPDVDYRLETWDARAQTLLEALPEKSVAAAAGTPSSPTVACKGAA